MQLAEKRRSMVWMADFDGQMQKLRQPTCWQKTTQRGGLPFADKDEPILSITLT